MMWNINRFGIEQQDFADGNESTLKRFKTLFLSDVHLGFIGCQAEQLLDFLKYHDADTIYLVGDIIDGWQLKSAWYWPQTHNDVVQKLLRKARKGARIVYIPGNHDDFLRSYYGTHFGDVEVVEFAIHNAADGKRYLVTHGDSFDLVVQRARWIALLGSHAYDAAITLNILLNAMRRGFGLPYWSLAQWLKSRVKNAICYIGEYEKVLAVEAKRHGADGVICGHIHHPAMYVNLGTSYINCGDWVENCTAVAEDHDGRMELISWPGNRPGVQGRVGVFEGSIAHE
jgi:UDP-2,3-diacylglucosamine pyrophosphatase LpxH